MLRTEEGTQTKTQILHLLLPPGTVIPVSLSFVTFPLSLLCLWTNIFLFNLCFLSLLGLQSASVLQNVKLDVA